VWTLFRRCNWQAEKPILAHILEQIAGRRSERTSNANDVLQGDIALTTFNAADIRPVEVSKFRQLFLGSALGLPQFADVPAESSLGVASHAGNLVVLTLIRRQTISSIDEIPQESEGRWMQQCLKLD
jgi:hypothetical protein